MGGLGGAQRALRLDIHVLRAFVRRHTRAACFRAPVGRRGRPCAPLCWAAQYIVYNVDGGTNWNCDVCVPVSLSLRYLFARAARAKKKMGVTWHPVGVTPMFRRA